MELARKGGLTSDEHFSVDGTLIDAWASMKSFRPKDEPKKPDDSNGWSDFKGQKRSNDTHESKTDPEAKLLRKSKGSASKLCFGMHVSMDDRNGLCVTRSTCIKLWAKPKRAPPSTHWTSSKNAASSPGHWEPTKGITTKLRSRPKAEIVKGCRERGVSPHCAQIEGRQVEGLDARTTKKGGYKASLIVRRRIEQIFGWAKSIGGLSKSAHRGMERVNAACQYVGGAYNLLRMARLAMSSYAPPTEVGA